MSEYDEIPIWNAFSVRSLQGTGKITKGKGISMDCHFRIWQLDSGQIVIELVVARRLLSSSDFTCEGEIEEGVGIDTGWQAQISGISLLQRYLPTMASEDHYYGIVQGYVRCFHPKQEHTESRQILCEVTNFYLAKEMEFEFGSLKVQLFPKTNKWFSSRVLEVPTIKAGLRISTQQSRSITDWEKITKDLIWLLSIANRGRVSLASQFLFEELDEHPFGYYMYTPDPFAYTYPRNQPLILTKDLGTFLLQTFEKGVQAYSELRLYAALEYYFRSVNSNSALVVGIGIVIALECIVSAYSSANNRDFIFTNDEKFGPISENLVAPILDEIAKSLPTEVGQFRLTPNGSEYQSWVAGLKSINRRSFKRKINELLKYLRIDPPKSNVLQRFVTIRNSFVHLGSPFITDDSVKAFSDVIDMIDFFERVLLACLSYRGEFRAYSYYTQAVQDETQTH